MNGRYLEGGRQTVYFEKEVMHIGFKSTDGRIFGS